MPIAYAPSLIRLLLALGAIVLVTAIAATPLLADSPGEYPLQYNVTPDAEEGTATFSFRAPATMSDVNVVIERDDGQRIRRALDDLQRGDSAEVTFEQPPGSHSYEGTIEGQSDDDRQLSFQLQMEVTLGQSLEIELLRDEVDLDARSVPLKANQPVERLDVRITDGDDQLIVDDSHRLGGQQGRIDVEWEADDSAEIAKVQVKAHDEQGSWTRHTLRPIQVRIPQQIINFETGSATIDPADVEKLEKTRERIREAIGEHEEFRSQLRLYVAGYTDTVGPAQNNLVLSERRARAIAKWFRNHGVDIPIYYQGFGQQVLAVDTPDETEEEQNRRAVYILANTPPPQSEDIPRSDWNQLR